jgi:hypothetical protein
MCTVTYIPSRDGFFITSSRDENKGRSRAIPPSYYAMKTGRILFPRDAQAGGSWFAVHENGNALVLLNGARVRHQPAPPYRRSRGIILLELADTDQPLAHFRKMDLDGIEPFTLVLAEGGLLYECFWDGISAQHSRIDAARPHIWSSVTLYDAAAIAQRRKWFEEWLRENQEPAQDKILEFHQSAGEGDRYNGLLMHRDDHMLTVSISSLQSHPAEGVLRYLDINDRDHADRQDLPPDITTRSSEQRILFRNTTLEPI